MEGQVWQQENSSTNSLVVFVTSLFIRSNIVLVAAVPAAFLLMPCLRCYLVSGSSNKFSLCNLVQNTH